MDGGNEQTAAKKTELMDLGFDGLSQFVKENGLPQYRAKQIYEWLLKGAEDFTAMSNLPASAKSSLSEKAVTGIPKILSCLKSKIDETRKYLFGLPDGCVVESVLMKYDAYDGYSACLSTQAGCRMGCKFCASSDIPFSRNLTTGELLGQIAAMNRDAGVRIGHIVLMGIGEPMDNYDNVIRFIREVSSENGFNISCRKISLSTCGVVPGILKLANEGLPVTLAVSLHNAYDSERSELMPINRKYSLDKLTDACKIYVERTGRRITFEYAMIAGVSDGEERAKALVKRLKGIMCHVNLIPVNTVSGKSFERSSRESISSFAAYLESHGIPATVRRELGSDINAACGQLRKQFVSNSGTGTAAENTSETD